MKEMIVKISEEDPGLVTQLLEKLGAEVLEKKPGTNKGASKTKTKKNEDISLPIYSENGKISTLTLKSFETNHGEDTTSSCRHRHLD